MQNIETAVSFMEQIAADNSHGYAQDNRTGNPDYDCSSLVGTALNKAGFKVNSQSTTRNLYSQLINCGFKSIGINDTRKRGDIFLSPGHHVVMCTDSNNIVHASINENGKTTKGIPGDQTGKEICTRSFYTPSYGWTYHLRYEDNTTTSLKTNSIKVVDVSKYNIITNYAQLAKEIPYIIIRIGYRAYANGKITEDPLFEKHITNAIANNMKIGIYFYDQSINEKEAEEQAVWVVNRIKKYNISLPIYLDSENIKNNAGRADNINVRQRTNNVIAFCNKIIESGYISGVYASDSWFKTHLYFDEIKGYNIWCARYSTNPPTISKYDGWQYGSEYYSWANDKIDSNYFYNLSGSNTVKPVNNKESYLETPILIVGVVAASSLNVRSEPSTNGMIINTLKRNSQIQLVSLTSNNWYKLQTGGYVSSKYIEILKAQVVNCNKLNVRSTPSSDNNDNIIKTVSVNTIATVMSKANGWYQLLFNDNTYGWCSGKYIKEL